MENQLISKRESRSVSTHNIEALAIELYHVNQLTSYPFSDVVLESWAVSLINLEPEITVEAINWITDRMKTGQIQFDGKKGIQNIFNGFRDYITFQIRNKADSKIDKWNDLHKKYNLEKNRCDGLL